MVGKETMEKLVLDWQNNIGSAYTSIKSLTDSGISDGRCHIDLNIAYCALCCAEDRLKEIFDQMTKFIGDH